MKKKHATKASLDSERLLRELESPEEQVRARAVRAFCPCRAGWETFEQNLDVLARLKKDPSPLVRAQALHVFEDAGEMQSSSYPTHPRQVTNDMIRKKRQSRFRMEDDDLAERKREREKPRCGRRHP